MLIFIENTPRTYSWGSRDALPELLGRKPNGEPQAELWLGDHPSAPASVAKASPARQTLIDLIESDPDLYGVDGRPLPFLLKVLAIGAPLSLQVHPDLAQARAGFDREEAAGVPLGARERNYGDANHKPELLVALSEVSALCGFRPLAEAQAELQALVQALAGAADAAYLADAAYGGVDLPAAARTLTHGLSLLVARAHADASIGVDTETETDPEADPETDPSAQDEAAAAAARRAFMRWALSTDPDTAREVQHAVRAITDLLEAAEPIAGLEASRTEVLRYLGAHHPGDPGVLLSLLLHHVMLQPGEAVYLAERQLHAYLGGIAIEVMATSDNVLRAGLTEKHVDSAELMRIVDAHTLAQPRFVARIAAPGLVAYDPEVADFSVMRARVAPSDEGEDARDGDAAESVIVDAAHPLVLIVTSGRVRVERVRAEFDEVANVRRGQSLYVSAGAPIELSGRGEAFLATVGSAWMRVS